MIGAVTLAVSALTFDRMRPLLTRLPTLDPRAASALRERRVSFPAAIDALGAALASGLSLPQAFAEVAASQPRGIRSPTSRVARGLALGAGLDEALISYRGAIPDEDVAPLAIVLGAFTRAGGRVGRSLSRVAVLLRGRLALEDEIRALTAQGRVSALVLLLLAPLGALVFALAMPTYVPTMLEAGRGLFATALALEIIAGLWLRRLLDLRSETAGLASLLDAVVVGLESGMTFEHALRSLTARAPALARLREARVLLADLALGQVPRRAFAAFGASGPAESRVAALISSSTRFGAPLADLLVVQADSLRESDRRRAEAAARRLPILMLFPLTLNVLPALLIVFLGPPLLSVSQ